MKRQSESSKSITQTSACYTSPLAQMLGSFLRKRVSFLIAALILSIASSAQDAPNPFTETASHLVTQVMDRAGSPGFVTLSLENRSSLSAADVAMARKAIEAQLRAVNVRLVKPERAVAEITVTISENLQGLLWVAEIKQGLTTQTVMLQSATAPNAATTRAPMLTLRRTPVFTQEDGAQLVDFALTDAKNLLVAEPERLVSYRFDGGTWKQINSFSIQHSHPWPRDLRGHFTVQQSNFNLSLPGVQCAGSLASENSVTAFTCSDADDPWPLDGASTSAFFPASRNFFSGLVRGLDQSLPPFYSAAIVGDTNPVWLFTGTDGRARLYFNLAQAPHVYSGWGSDVAAIHSGCGSQWQVLVSSQGDHSQADSVHAMEILNREPAPVSAPLELDGAITSMWRAVDAATANLITQNITSKKYEASILSVDCSH